MTATLSSQSAYTLLRPIQLQRRVTYCPCLSAVSIFRATNTRKKLRPCKDPVRHKWSQKPLKRTEKFPWQDYEVEAVGQLKTGIGVREEAETSVNVPIESAKEVSDSLVTYSMPSHMIGPPWVHGNNSLTETYFITEGEDESGNVAFQDALEREIGHEVGGNSGNFDSDLITLNNGESDGNALKSVKFCLHEDEQIVENSCDDYGGSSATNNLPWKQKGNVVRDRKMAKIHTRLAEASLPEHELKRLRNKALRLSERINVKISGITEELVNDIHEKWKSDELVKLKFEKPLSRNMNMIHGILERRTNGLVIWRSGSSVVLYRGIAFKLDCVKSYFRQSDSHRLLPADHVSSHEEPYNFNHPNNLYEVCDEAITSFSEIDQFLDLLGPRFADWNGSYPIPVDADMLPTIVPGYKSPPRSLPHGMSSSLKDEEMTSFRRLARQVPPQFALGKCKGLQGLAYAMVRLWEKSAIAKIAIKRGVEHIRNEKIAAELKILTGGILLSRNKEFIVFYRGNDFMPSTVIEQLKERQKVTFLQQDNEEDVRKRASTFIEMLVKPQMSQSMTGTLAETMEASYRWGKQPRKEVVNVMIKRSSAEKITSRIVHLDRKLALVKNKLKRSERSLAKVEKNMEPVGFNEDIETINDAERFLFRKIGLSMKPFLVVGTREVFDGTIENMHLHWKHRELVKIIVKRQNFEKVKEIATNLEAESGGILVSVDKTSKGYVSIFYRGKNYSRPVSLKPKNLLTKRQALARSIELQRCQGLERYYWELQQELGSCSKELAELGDGMKIKDASIQSRFSDASS